MTLRRKITISVVLLVLFFGVLAVSAGFFYVRDLAIAEGRDTDPAELARKTSLFWIVLVLAGAFAEWVFVSVLVGKFLKAFEIVEKAALRMAQGDMKIRIEEKGLGGELKKLAVAFNAMVVGVVRSREEVDKKVEAQIAEIQEKKREIEDQQRATVNILEDVNNSQEELKLRYRELDIIKSLTQKLGMTLEERPVMKNIAASLQDLFSEATVSYVIFPLLEEKRIDKPSPLYIHSLKKIGQPYIDQVGERLKLGLKIMPLYLKKKKNWNDWVRQGFFAQVEGDIVRMGEGRVPHSHVNIPIVVQNALAGMVNLSSDSYELFNDQKSVEIANMVVENAVQTIARLKMLITSEHSRLQDLLESMKSAVAMFDEYDRMVVVNSAAKEIFNLSSASSSLDDVLGFLEQGRVSGNVSPDIKKLYIEAVKNNRTQKIDSLEIDRHFFEVVISPVNDLQKAVSGGVIILHDITNLKEIDRMKTEFVSVASHQLRTPLTAINWYVEMLQSGDAGKLSKNQKEYLDEIYKGSVRMVRLVNELLNVSRLETGRLKVSPKPVQMEVLIENIIHEVQSIADKSGCKLRFEKPRKRLPKVPIDEVLMRQVIHNMITNAIRYSSQQKGEISVTLSEKGKDYLVSVADQGIGIPKEAQGKIFQKFFRADNARKKEGEGSGIGMYISKMIMEASSGKIWFISPTLKRKGADGKIEKYGTTFIASIPKKGMIPHEGEKSLAI